MPNFYGAIDLLQNELRNARIQNLGGAPASPVPGQLYYNSSTNILYWWSGSAWVAAMGGAGAVPADTVTSLAFAGAAVPGASALYSRGDHAHGMPAHDGPAHSAVPLSSLGPPTVSLNLNGQTIQNLGNPVNPQDAVNYSTLQNYVAGLSWKAPCRAATTANITLSGTQTIDGVGVVVGDRVLVKNQTTQSANGIYVVATGAWTRATDMATATQFPNAAVFVSLGTTQADTAWVQTADNVVVGTTAITWVQFGAAGTYQAGNGLTLTGNVFAVGQGTGIVVNPTNVAIDASWLANWAATQAFGRKYAAALVGTASPELVTHNLNTRDVQVTVLNGASPYTAVEVDWDATSVNSVTIRYNPNLGAGYRIVVTG
jgi:hypothetical protein